MICKDARAFTLLEVVIVLLLSGLLYTLAVTSFEKKQPIEQFDFKKALLHYMQPYNKRLDFVIRDGVYTLFVDGKRVTHHLQIPNMVRFFSFDAHGDTLTEFGEYSIGGRSSRVDFAFVLYADGTHLPLIVANSMGYGIYRSYFDGVEYFESFEEAKEALLYQNIKEQIRVVSE